MRKLTVPRAYPRARLQTEIRHHFEKKYQEKPEIRIDMVFVPTKDRAYIRLGIIHDMKDDNRFEVEEQHLSFRLEPRPGLTIAEG